jgi:glycosyltransferase involved in cell wall biosynthesis
VTQEISRPHRIALVTGVLDLGGTTTFLCNFAGELLRRGIPTQVFSFEQDNPLALDFNRLKIPLFTTDHRRLIYEDRLVLLLRELARFQPTVVIANLSATSFEVLRYVPPGVFRIGTAQSHDRGTYKLIGFYAPHVDLMAAVSKTIQQTVQSMPEFGRVAVRYLPLGVPIPEQIVPRSADDTAPLRLLYLGRLQREQKRVQLFPEILQALQAAGIPFHWTIAGAGPEEEWLKSAMKTSSPAQSVSFPGRVLYADVPQLLAAHDVFLLASSYEGLPLSLVEAMGCGLVPVVSDLPSGVRELVDDTTGKRVPPNDTRGYAEAVIWLHRHRPDLRRFAQNAREKVRAEFSVPAMTDRWLGALPPPPTKPLTWPQRWTPKPILESPNQWWFSPPLRLLRRILVRFRI